MEKLVDEQGGVPVTVLQAAEAGWLHVVRRKLEKAVADDESVPEMLAVSHARIKDVGISQSCMISKLPVYAASLHRKQTTPGGLRCTWRA